MGRVCCTQVCLGFAEVDGEAPTTPTGQEVDRVLRQTVSAALHHELTTQTQETPTKTTRDAECANTF